MRSKIFEQQLNIYQKNFLKFGNSPLGTFQNDRATQYLRFEKLIEKIDTSERFSIHDVGCGICDLHKFLIKKKIKHTYYGSEIVPEMIAFSKKQYRDMKIYRGDIRTIKNVNKCNYFVLSGTMNLKNKISMKVWKAHCFQIVEKMFQLSKNGIAFNFLSSYNTFSANNLAYFDPEELLKYCLTKLSRFAILDCSYPLYEGTITVFKKEFLKTSNLQKEFFKYFR